MISSHSPNQKPAFHLHFHQFMAVVRPYYLWIGGFASTRSVFPSKRNHRGIRYLCQVLYVACRLFYIFI